MTNGYFLPAETFIENLKRAAKTEKKRSTEQHNYAFYLDKIASLAGFPQWALLHKKVNDMLSVDPQYNALRKKINSGITKIFPNAAQDYVTHDLKTFFKNTFEKGSEFHIDFSTSRDNYSHQIINVREAIEESYKGVYPESLLEEAIEILENEGPWIFDDEYIADYAILDSGN